MQDNGNSYLFNKCAKWYFTVVKKNSYGECRTVSRVQKRHIFVQLVKSMLTLVKVYFISRPKQVLNVL